MTFAVVVGGAEDDFVRPRTLPYDEKSEAKPLFLGASCGAASRGRGLLPAGVGGGSVDELELRLE